MLSLVSGTVQWILRKPERRFLFLGLDDAGKTTCLEQLKSCFGQKQMTLSNIPPTIGMNVAQIEITGVVCTFWDLGGHKNFRVIWKNYFKDVQGIAFIVDASAPSRFGEAKAVLMEVLKKFDAFSSDIKSRSLPVTLIFNKSDLINSSSTDVDIESDHDSEKDNQVLKDLIITFDSSDEIKKLREGRPVDNISMISALKSNAGLKETILKLVADSLRIKDSSV